jgi:hypothetical protein
MKDSIIVNGKVDSQSVDDAANALYASNEFRIK